MTSVGEDCEVSNPSLVSKAQSAESLNVLLDFGISVSMVSMHLLVSLPA